MSRTVAVVKTHGAWPEAPWKPLAPHMASACAGRGVLSCAFLAVCPRARWSLQNEQGWWPGSYEKQALGFSQTLLCEVEWASFPRRRLGMSTLTDVTCFPGTDV